MLFKAEHDCNTYKLFDLHNAEDMYYSKKKGFHDDVGNDWNGCSFDVLNDLIHDDGEFSNGWKLVDQTISFQEMCELAFSGEHTLFEDSEGDRLVYSSAIGGMKSFFWGGDYKYPISLNVETTTDRYKKVYR